MKMRYAVVRVGIAVALVLAVSSPAQADKKLTDKWRQALKEKKGNWGWIGTWLITDRCAKKGFRSCPHFGKVIGGKIKKWPADFISDALKLNSSNAGSQVCVDAWGCDLLDPALEMVAAAHRPDGKKILSGFLTKHEKLWTKGTFRDWRPMFVRLIGWYGDRSLAPLIVKMAKVKTGLNSDYITLAASSWILSRWGNKDLLGECKAVWNSSSRKREANVAREACINYFLEFGDTSMLAKIKQYQPNNIRTKLVRAVMGDKSMTADWKDQIKRHKKPTHTKRIEATTALAALGDRKATKAALAGLKSGEAQVVEGYAKLLLTVRGTKYGKKAVKALKKGLKKVTLKDERSARALAFGAAYLLRNGEKSALGLVKKVFASDKKAFRRQMAKCLAGSARNAPIIGPDSGLFGGVPVAGIGKILAKAYENEADAGTRGDIGVAWVMLNAVGGK